MVRLSAGVLKGLGASSGGRSSVARALVVNTCRRLP